MSTTLDENLNIISENETIEIERMDGDLNIIQKLDDEPNDVGGLTAQELKAEFDKAGNIIKQYINETLVPKIIEEDATNASRAAAEAERAAAETARTLAEQSRADDEAARGKAEQARADAESARAKAEQARVAAEESRVLEEKRRSIWEEYDAAKEYQPGNKVAYDGSSYLNISTCTGVKPDSDETYWLLIAKKGMDGSNAVAQRIWHINGVASTWGGEVTRLSNLYHLSGSAAPSLDAVRGGDLVICSEDGAVLRVDYVSDNYFGADIPVAGLTSPLFYLDGYTSVTAAVEEALTAAKESGEFDGAAGQNGQDGQDGKDGADGVSPTVSVEEITGGHRLTITDANESKTVDIMDGATGAAGAAGRDGATGQDGANGVSPTVEVTEIDGGHTVAITDAEGTKSFDVLDGADGEAASPYALEGEEFSAGIDMNTLVPDGSNCFKVFKASDSAGTNINIPAELENKEIYPTVIAVRYGVIGMKTFQFFISEATDVSTSTKVWARNRVSTGVWSDWVQVYPAPVPVLEAPGGTKYQLAVADDGTLSAEVVA